MFAVSQDEPSFSPVLGLNRKPKGRSLLERDSVRATLIPKNAQKTEIIFSPFGNYDDDTEIYAIHKYVLEHFQNQNREIPGLRKQIEELRLKQSSGQLRVVDLKLVQTEIKKIEDAIEKQLSEEKSREYLERISPILEEWTALRKSEGPFFKFGDTKRFCPVKLSLVRNFIQIATEYVPLNLTSKPCFKTGLCPYCRKPFEDEDGKIACYDCGLYTDALTYEAEFGDLSRINGASNNNYINRETFMKALCCYQGKQKAEFPAELRTKFDEHCRFNHINKKELTYEKTRPIFKSIGYSGFFDDINLFLSMHSEIQRRLPDLSDSESLIIQDYDQFSQKYADIKGDERDSALNAWYLLYILCRRRGLQCDRHDLKMPDTPAIRISNDNIARKVFESLDWTFEDTI